MRFLSAGFALLLGLALVPRADAVWEIRRLLPEGAQRALVPVEAGHTTRPALCVNDGTEPTVIDLGKVEGGRLTTYVARLSTPAQAGFLTLTLAVAGHESGVDVCQLEYRPGKLVQAWRECDMQIREGTARAAIIVRAAAGARDFCLAAPFLRSLRPSPKPSIFVILTDTLRADRLALFNRAVPLGRELQRFAADGIVFEDARSPSSKTRPAVATLLTGLSPLVHRVVSGLDSVSAALDTLPEILRRHGYLTFAWSTNPNVLPIWGFDQGFDVFVDVGAMTRAGRKADASLVLARARHAIERTLGPAFYYVHLMDPHGPYTPAKEDLEAIRRTWRLRASVPGRPPRPKRAGGRDRYERYLAEIRGMDAQLGEFLRFLRRENLYEDSLILIVADHGEEFWDHDGVGHGRTLYEEMLHVPAVLKLPGQKGAGGRVAYQVILEDFVPTLLSAAGIPVPPGLDGVAVVDAAGKAMRPEPRSSFAALWPQRRARNAWRFGRSAAIRNGRWKLVVDYDGKRTELYDLVKDPREQSNLALVLPERTRALRELLDAGVARREHGWHVRVCGGAASAKVTLELRGRIAGFTTYSVETDDQVVRRSAAAGQDRIDAMLSLPARKQAFKAFGRRTRMTIRDEDEIVVVPADEESPLFLRALSGDIAFSWGGKAARQQAREIRLDPARALADAGGSLQVECFAGGLARKEPHDPKPYLRLWRVSAARPTTPRAIDPETAARLRALGYKW